jgi:hypothetical protein
MNVGEMGESEHGKNIRMALRRQWRVAPPSKTTRMESSTPVVKPENRFLAERREVVT